VCGHAAGPARRRSAAGRDTEGVDWQATPYTAPAALAGVLVAALGLSVWRRRPAAGAAECALFALAVSVWCLANAGEFASASLGGKLLWTRIEYIGVVAAPPLWLAGMVAYTGLGSRVPRRRLTFLAIVPITTTALVWTNDWHHLVWTSSGLVTIGSYTVWTATYGLWFWVHAAYCYLVLGLAAILVLRWLWRSPRPYRGQAVSLLVGMVAPWLANVAYIARVGPFPPIDLTSFGFAFGSVAVGLGQFRLGLFGAVPLAREALFEQLPDAAVVLDPCGRVIGLNPAAQRLLALRGRAAIGRSAADALVGWPRWITRASAAARHSHSTELTLVAGGGRRHFDARISALTDRHGRPVGRLVVLRDITEKARAEREHEQLIREQAARAEAERARGDLRFLARASLELASSLDYETTLATAARLAVPSLGDWCFVTIAPVDDNEQAQEQVAMYAADAPGTPLRQLVARYPFAPGLAPGVADVSSRGRPVAYPTISDALLQTAARDAESLALLRAVCLRRAVVLPLVAYDRVLGALSCYSLQPGRHDGPDAMALAEELARRCALAISNARLYQEQRELVRHLRQLRDQLEATEREQVVTDERHRIAHELHDRVAQTFFSIGLTTRAALDQATDPGDAVHGTLASILRSAEQGAGQVRDAIFALTRAEVHDRGLVEALWQLVRNFQQATGIEADLVVSGAEHRAPPEVAEALHAIARGALDNVGQHARASAVVVSLRFEPDAATLTVQDDGVGASPLMLSTLADSATRFGLRGMRERVVRQGGTFTAAPGDEGGFVVRVCLPLPDPGVVAGG